MVEGSLLEWSPEGGHATDSDRVWGSSARAAAIGVPPDIAAKRLELLKDRVGDHVVRFGGGRGLEGLRGLRRRGRGARLRAPGAVRHGVRRPRAVDPLALEPLPGLG